MEHELGFKERSAWINAAIMLLLAGYYYVEAFAGEPLSPAQTLGLLFRVVLFIVIVETVSHAALAILTRDTETDERDRLVGARAGNLSGYVLGFFVVTTIDYAMLFSAIDNRTQVCNPRSMATAAHLLVFGMVVSEFSKAAAQLFLYRRGL